MFLSETEGLNRGCTDNEEKYMHKRGTGRRREVKQKERMSG